MRAIRKARNFLRSHTTTTSSVAAIAALALAGCQSPTAEPVGSASETGAETKSLAPYPKLSELAYLSVKGVESKYGKGTDMLDTAVGIRYEYTYGNGRTFRCWYMGDGVRRVEIQLDEPKLTRAEAIAEIIGPQKESTSPSQQASNGNMVGGNLIRSIQAGRSPKVTQGYDLVRVEFSRRLRQELTIWQPVDTLPELPDISGFAYADRETLVRAFGKPNDARKGKIPMPVDHFFLPSGDELAVQYENGKTVLIRFPLGGPYRDPSEALRKVGIDPGLQKPTMRNSSAKWTGSVAGLPTKSITVGRDHLGSDSYTTAFTFIQVEFKKPATEQPAIH